MGLVVQNGDCDSLAKGGFNGFYTYFAAQGFVFSSTLHHWPAQKECAKRLQPPALFIPSVGPGYDDSPVRPWNMANTRARRDGAYYEEMWNAALDLESEVVSITSFNEWHEGSQIEKAVVKKGYENYGRDPSLYLKLTKRVGGCLDGVTTRWWSR